MVAAAVAVLGAVERGRRRVGDEEVHGVAADPDRHVPVGLAGEPQDPLLLGRVEVGGDQVARHVLPPELLEGAHLAGVDREAAEHRHAVLTLELTEPVGVVAAADGAVVVEVVAAWDARVGRRHVRIPVADRLRTVVADLEVVLAEQVDGLAVRHVVELVEEQDVGAGALDDLGDGGRLGVVRRGQVLDQLAGAGPVERGVEGLEPHRRVVCVAVTAVVVVAAGVGGRRHEERGGEGEESGGSETRP